MQLLLQKNAQMMLIHYNIMHKKLPRLSYAIGTMKH